MNELKAPPAAERDGQSWELLRVWIAEQGLHCSMKVGVYEAEGISEERAWGIVLADAARHVADAISAMRGGDQHEALQAIRFHFDNELDRPTSQTQGSFRD